MNIVENCDLRTGCGEKYNLEGMRMDHTAWNRRILHRCSCPALSLFILLTLLPIPASAAELCENVVRVGSFEGTYNVINEKGERNGYGYEYLQNIAGYAGWTYEYVTSNWEDCFTQLENVEIDILGGIS